MPTRDDITSFPTSWALVRLSLLPRTHACPCRRRSTETGQVTLPVLRGLHDCGTVVKPMLRTRPVLGAIAMGIGRPLWESRLRRGRRLAQPTRSSATYCRAPPVPAVHRDPDRETPFAVRDVRA